jgi:hypothetical protein
MHCRLTIRLYSTCYPVHPLLTGSYVRLLLPLQYALYIGTVGRALTFGSFQEKPGDH